MATLTDSDTVVALSVTLNGAYFTVTSFLNPMAADQRSLLKLARIAAENINNSTKMQKLFKRIHDLENRTTIIEYKEKKALSVIRMASISAFITGAIVLSFSSIFPHFGIPNYAPCLIVLLDAPFLLGVLYVIAIESPRYREVRDARRSVEQKIRTTLQRR